MFADLSLLRLGQQETSPDAGVHSRTPAGGAALAPRGAAHA